MQNWKVTPAEVFAASPLVPVMVINDLEQALPMAKALLDGGISVFEITLRTPVALEAIALIAKAMPDAMVGAGTVLNCAQFDAAVAAGARFVISPGMTPALLAHAARSTAPLIPGVATPSEVMQALEAGYDHLKFFPAEANGGTKALAAIAPAPGEILPHRRHRPEKRGRLPGAQMRGHGRRLLDAARRCGQERQLVGGDPSLPRSG